MRLFDPAALLCLCSLLYSSQALPASSTCSSQLEALRGTQLDAPLQEFDQTPGSGWRSLEEKGCHREAAALLAEYQDRHRSKLQLKFHEAQALALAGDHLDAVQAMRLTITDPESNRGGFLWNDYVFGVIGFLESDYTTLLRSIEALATMPEKNAKNLDVLRRLAKGFGLPYGDALHTAVPKAWDPACFASSDESLALTDTVSVVMLGEIHGTEEVPQFAAALSCQLGRRGRSVILALEMPTSTQPGIDRLLQTGGRQSEDLLQSRFWAKATPFGVSSAAMFELLMKVAKGQLPEVRSVLAFDPEPMVIPEGVKPDVAAISRERDAGMARNLAASIKANPDSVHVVIVGGAHASRLPGSERDRLYEPLGLILSKSFPLANFILAHDSGQAWVCQPSFATGAETDKRDARDSAQPQASRPTCGPEQIEAYKPGSTMPRGLLATTARAGFDGVFYVGKLTPSSPQRMRQPQAK